MAFFFIIVALPILLLSLRKPPPGPPKPSPGPQNEKQNGKRNEKQRLVTPLEAWADKGWEVAVFYWDNFADEALVTNAEAKIWTSESPVGMRYWTS